MMKEFGRLIVKQNRKKIQNLIYYVEVAVTVSKHIQG